MSLILHNCPLSRASFLRVHGTTTGVICAHLSGPWTDCPVLEQGKDSSCIESVYNMDGTTARRSVSRSIPCTMFSESLVDKS